MPSYTCYFQVAFPFHGSLAVMKEFLMSECTKFAYVNINREMYGCIIV